MPRRTEVDLVVPAPVEQVEAALAASTRRALFPSFTTIWAGGEQPFKGRVSGARFTLAPNQASWVRGVHSVARGELTASDGGTRVRAEVGLHPAVVWLYRVSVVWGAVVLAGVGGSLLLQEPSIVLAWLALGVLGLVGGVGYAVSRAEQEIPSLVAALESTAMAAASGRPESVAEEPSLRDIMKAKRAAAAKRESS